MAEKRNWKERLQQMLKVQKPQKNNQENDDNLPQPTAASIPSTSAASQNPSTSAASILSQIPSTSAASTRLSPTPSTSAAVTTKSPIKTELIDNAEEPGGEQMPRIYDLSEDEVIDSTFDSDSETEYMNAVDMIGRGRDQWDGEHYEYRQICLISFTIFH